MTERERWIVYPLLFLALGSALRDKLINQTRSKSIECQELTIFGEDRDRRQLVPLVQIGEADVQGASTRPFGKIVVEGVVSAQAIRAETVFADNLVFRGIPIGPNMLSPTDWLRALQQAAAAKQNEGALSDPPPGKIVPLSPRSPARPDNPANSAPAPDGDDGADAN